MPRTRSKAAALNAPLFDEWLSIEETCPGYVLPGRAAVIAWCVQHAAPVLAVTAVAFLVPLLALIGGH